MVSQILGRIRDAVRYLSKFPRRRADSRAYVTHYRTTVTNGGGTANLRLKNPTDSTTIDVQILIVSSQFRGEYVIHDSFSSDPSGGSANSIDNLVMDESSGSPDSGDMTATTEVTFTSDGERYAEVLPSGGQGGNTSGGKGNATEPLIEPGREIVIELINDSSNSRPGSIGVVYTEMDNGV